MDKYIKLDTAKKTLLDYIYEFDASRANPDFVRGITYAREGLDRVPLEDVAPVVHGHWEYIQQTLNTPSQLRCSFCGWWSLDPSIDGAYNYCPNCGAKMGKEDF